MDVGYVESFGAAVPSAAAPELESEPQDVQTGRARASAGIRAAMFTNRGPILMLRSLRAHGRATRGVRRKTPGARTICRREAACHQPQGAPVTHAHAAISVRAQDPNAASGQSPLRAATMRWCSYVY